MPSPRLRRWLPRQLELVRLEDRTVPAFTGGANVAAGDWDGDFYPDIVTGAGPTGGPHVRVFSGRTGDELASWMATDPDVWGGVNVAVGDVTGDGRAEVITGAGVGVAPEVRIWEAPTARLLAVIPVFDPAFVGGVNVAVGDVTGDGTGDIIVGARAGGGPHVKVIDGRTRGVVRDFFAFDPDFTGGVNVAAADLTGDGRAEVIAAAGAGGPPEVRVFDGVSGREVRRFLAYTANFTGGASVAVGDVTGDGKPDILTGAGQGGGPHVKAFDGVTFTEVFSFYAYAESFTGGANVAAFDLTADRVADILTGAGPGGGPHVRALRTGDGAELASFYAYDSLNANAGFSLPDLPPVPGVPPIPPVPPPVSPPGVPPVPPPSAVSTADFMALGAFIYTGPDAIQTGVADGTIDPLRAAIVRGTVTTRDGSPLAGVVVRVLNHPEFGQSRSRADGTFDLVVNGGGLLTFDYSAPGFLPVQRALQVPWRNFALLPAVALTPLDVNVTTIDLSSTAPFQVARGSVETDADGTRRATLLFPQGVQATMTLPDGTTRPLTSLDVRATEYTVGAAGPAAMPGGLPPASGYTYAVELSIDEALAAEATQVAFTQAVPFYLENFLSFPVGMAVPAGFYDRERGQWVAAENGKVISIVNEASGLAELDTDGDGTADAAGVLATLGITPAEQAQLAGLYDPGASLWRVPVSHFTPWDYNWPYGPPPDARPPQIPDPAPPPDQVEDQDNPDDIPERRTPWDTDWPYGPPADARPPREFGHIPDPSRPCSCIDPENLAVREVVPVGDTPFSLVNQSRRAAGRTAERALTIPLTGATTPAGLKRVDLKIEVAGRQFAQSFTPAPNQTTEFIWDGKDVFGRTLGGTLDATVNVGYVYDAVYYEPAAFERAFGATSGVPISGDRARQEITLSQTVTAPLTNTVSDAAVGGWTLDVHHRYDPAARTLHQGDGRDRRSTSGVNAVVERVAGGPFAFGGDGGPATEANLGLVGDVAVAPDGSLYLTGSLNRVRRVGPDGVIETVAGTGVEGFGGDGGPATAAQLNAPAGVAVGADGSLYIADTLNNRVRRVRPDGIIETIAGTGELGSGGDGGPATAATLNTPNSLAVGPDGSVYVVEAASHRVRRIAPDGTITAFAGNGTAGFGGDGGPAQLAALNLPLEVAVGPDGNVSIADRGNARVRRVSTDGTITTVAGTGATGFNGDGRAAGTANLSADGVAVGADGTLYISDSTNRRVRRVGSDGVVITAAGTGFGGGTTTGGHAAGTDFSNPFRVTIGPDGSIYIVNETAGPPTEDGGTSLHVVYKVRPALPGFTAADLVVPSADGRQLFLFTPTGQHRLTRDALTGAVVYAFDYDPAGRLMRVTDGSNQATTIERDAAGNPTALVGPFGARTLLTVNTEGLLASITNPAGGGFTFAYAAGGLLNAVTDPLGRVSRRTFDTRGRLTRDDDPLAGFTQFTRRELDGGFEVTTTDADGTARGVKVETLPDGTVRRTRTDADGLTTITLIAPDGDRTTTAPDGTVTTVEYAPDPRYGMVAPVVARRTVTTPGGLTSTTRGFLTAVFDTPGDPNSPLVTLTGTTVVNGQVFTTAFNRATNTVKTTTAAGRETTFTLDSFGRVAEVLAPGVATTVYTYDTAGRLGGISQGGRVVTNTYDAAGRLASVTDSLARTTRFEYDAAGRLLRQIQPDGGVIALTYDAAGNMVGFTPPGQPEHTFGYDADNRLVRVTPPTVGGVDDSSRYVYDLARRLAEESLPGGGAIAYAYSDGGRLTGITAPWGGYAFTYGAATGRLTQLASPGGFTLTFGSDGRLRTSEALAGPVNGRVARTFDTDFRVASESVNGGPAVAFGYDADGLLTGAGDLTLTRDTASGRITGTTLGVTDDGRTYNEFGELVRYTVRANSAELLDIVYTRDAAGRVVRKVETIDGTTTTTDYTFDPNGRVQSETENGVSVRQYTYDANGNRLTLTTPGGTTAATYDAQDRLLTIGTRSYAHDTNGAVREVTDSATGQTTRFTTDAFENLTRVDLPGGTVIEYLTDGLNRRVGVKVNGMLTAGFIYDAQSRPVAKLGAAGNVAERYVYADDSVTPAYVVKGGENFRLVSDQTGSVRLVVNAATGAVVQRLDYDAFGRVSADTAPGFQPFGYAGGLYDPATGLVRTAGHDYDAATGRWTTKDPAGVFAGPNVYTPTNP